MWESRLRCLAIQRTWLPALSEAAINATKVARVWAILARQPNLQSQGLRSQLEPRTQAASRRNPFKPILRHSSSQQGDVFKERTGFVYLETTVTLTTRGYLLSILRMLFLTQGESAWWPRNMREPQGSGCEQPSLLWFSFFIMFDIFEAELFKKYQF